MSFQNPTLAEVKQFGGNFAPRGWALCNGQLMAIASNTALFSLIGTTYGGDGRTTFALPDLRSRVARHPGTGDGLDHVRLGQRGGWETHQLTQSEMPSHNHAMVLHAEATVATAQAPAGKMVAVPASAPIYAEPIAKDDVPMTPTGIVVSHAGGSIEYNQLNPFEGINFIIALIGDFPTRS